MHCNTHHAYKRLGRPTSELRIIIYLYIYFCLFEKIFFKSDPQKNL